MIKQRSFWAEVGKHSVFCYEYEGASTSTPILLPNPFGPEYMHCHASLRLLAIQLAKSGFTVWRFDWPGYGNSSGVLPIENSLHESSAILTALINELTNIYDQKPALISLRSSALLTPLIDLSSIEYLVLWHPYTQGASFIRDLEIIDNSLNSIDPNPAIVTAGGYPLYRCDANAISELKLNSCNVSENKPVLLIHADTTKRFPFLKPFDKAGIEVTKVSSSELKGMARQAELSVPAMQDFEEISKWLSSKLNSAQGSLKNTVDSETLDITSKIQTNVFKTDAFSERSLHLGSSSLFGVITTPADGTIGPCLVIPNTGSGHHPGPNGLHTLIARTLAKSGITTVRFDLSQLGNSGLSNTSDAYSSTAAKDVDLVEKYMRSLGADKIIFFGLCSGAFSIFQYGVVAEELSSSAFIFANVNTFYWQEGENTVVPESAQANIESSYYKGQLSNFAAWKALLLSPSKWGRILGKVSKMMLVLASKLYKKFSKNLTPLDKDLQILISRGHRILFYFSPHEPGLELINAQASHTIKTQQENVTVTIQREGDHTFTTLKSRFALVSYLEEQVTKLR